MPTFVGNVHIVNNSGTVQFGNTANNSPKSVSKTFSGAGSDNSGNVVNVVTERSETNTWDIGGLKCSRCSMCRKRSRRAKGRKRI
ncbi:spore germination protein [Brevibacillus gelatini]|uniref:spore germination protein n=1 Tax=Brevibacillus gelatini TaxID=1655277 RepID=UPI003D815F55